MSLPYNNFGPTILFFLIEEIIKVLMNIGVILILSQKSNFCRRIIVSIIKIIKKKSANSRDTLTLDFSIHDENQEIKTRITNKQRFIEEDEQKPQINFKI